MKQTSAERTGKRVRRAFLVFQVSSAKRLRRPFSLSEVSLVADPAMEEIGARIRPVP